MGKPGFHLLKELGSHFTGRPLNSSELSKLPAGTQIYLHHHPHDRFQHQIQELNRSHPVLDVIRGRRKATYVEFDIDITHQGHSPSEKVPHAINYLLELLIDGGKGLRGAEPGFTRPRRHQEVPAFLRRQPIKTRRSKRS